MRNKPITSKGQTQSRQVFEWKGDLETTDRCHCCQFPSPLRPHIVWFGEMPIGYLLFHASYQYFV